MLPMPTDKPTWGGARKGTGRKPVGVEPRTARLPQVKVTERERVTLATRAEERGLSESEAIRTALRVDGLID